MASSQEGSKVNWRGYYTDHEVLPGEEAETLTVDCHHCENRVDALILNRFVTKPNRFFPLPSQDMRIYNFFLRCPNCKGAILVLWSHGTVPYGKGFKTTGKFIFP
jgi:hypothetical protein